MFLLLSLGKWYHFKSEDTGGRSISWSDNTKNSKVVQLQTSPLNNHVIEPWFPKQFCEATMSKEKWYRELVLILAHWLVLLMYYWLGLYQCGNTVSTIVSPFQGIRSKVIARNIVILLGCYHWCLLWEMPRHVSRATWYLVSSCSNIMLITQSRLNIAACVEKCGRRHRHNISSQIDILSCCIAGSNVAAVHWFIHNGPLTV